MATINDGDTVRNLIRNSGFYKGGVGVDAHPDPQLLSIYMYANNWGNVAYSLCYRIQDEESLKASHHIHGPVLLWSRDSGITLPGAIFLNEGDGAV